MSTYRERERRRKARGPHVFLTIMVYWLAAGVSQRVAEAVGGLLWAPRWDQGVVAWGEESNGLQLGLEVVNMGPFERKPFCRFHWRNVSDERLPVADWYPFDRSVEIAGRESPFPPVVAFGHESSLPRRSIRPHATSVDWRWVDLDRWDLSGRNRIDISWVYRNDRAEMERERPAGGERETVTYSGIWTGEARSGAIHISLGVPWYGYVLHALILLGGISLAVKGLDLYKKRKLAAASEPEAAESPTKESAGQAESD